MRRRKPYKCLVCGAEVPNLPMSVLKHQMSHMKPRPFARDRREPERAEAERRKGSGDGSV